MQKPITQNDIVVTQSVKKKYSLKLTRSHLSTHFAWNSCEHGSTRNVCRGSKSQMQMTHDVWSPACRRTKKKGNYHLVKGTVISAIKG